MSKNNGDGYRDLVEGARVDYAAAAAVARAKNEQAAGIWAEIEAFEAELEGIKSEIAAFEAGRLIMPADDFMRLSDRVRWLEVMIRGMKAQYKSVRSDADLAGLNINHVAGAARSRLNEMIRAEVEGLTAARRAELEEVLKG